MATYKSKPIEVPCSAEALFDRFSDMSRLEGALEKLPEEARTKLGDLKFSSDTLTIVTPQVGEITFNIEERKAPSHITFGTPNSPVPLKMFLDITPDGADRCKVETTIDVQIPAMLRPMVGPKLQEAANKFGDLIGTLGK